MISCEISSNRRVISLLGIRNAQVRLVAFLLYLSERSRPRGRSADEFTLPLSHTEIGSYLALSRAAVSGEFSRLQAAELMQVRGRRIKLLDLPYLKQLAGKNLAFSPV